MTQFVEIINRINALYNGCYAELQLLSRKRHSLFVIRHKAKNPDQ